MPSLSTATQQKLPDAPNNPTSLFVDYLGTLKSLYGMNKIKSLETMKELWYSQLKASGNAPQTEHNADDLFVLHTLLITISSTISALILGRPPKLRFAAWVNGTQWFKDIQNTISQYNWQHGKGDVLRELYNGIIDKKYRKIYGEFYTPDWLAELLCLKVLGDRWIEKCISEHFVGKYSGVLDPACGSGTFLYHAVRRIAESKPVRKSGMSPDDITEMIIHLVNGIDIHPVSVEMARANVLMALPTIPNCEIRVWHGDSLQTDKTCSLMQEKVSRIVANPPWVRLSNIRDKTRKKEIIESAKAHEIWVGGKNAAGFDVSSLFVIKCISLYLHENDKSGWVLPQAEMRGENWSKYREKLGGQIKQTWDLGTLPFREQSKSCVNVVGSTAGSNVGGNIAGDNSQKHAIQKLEKKKDTKISSTDCWGAVREKTKWVADGRTFPAEQSRWCLDNDVSVRRGATLFPNCFIRISEWSNIDSDAEDMVSITTVQSRHAPWKTLGSITGVIPKRWIRNVVTSAELLPYVISEPSQCIIPLDESLAEFDRTMVKWKYWRDADFLYRKYMGSGSNTPKTLLDNINHKSKLEKQFDRKYKHLVAYNKAGNWLCAARIKADDIVTDSAYCVGMKTRNEALFLTVLLNTDALQQAYKSSRKSDRDFHTHFWKVVPLPRYDRHNDLHVRLVKLAVRAEKVAGACPIQKRKSIREFLREDGVSGEMDEIVRELLPEYVT